MPEYELAADVMHVPTNEEGKPFTYKTITKGGTVTIEDEERAQELIDAGALVNPEVAKSRKSNGGKDEGPAQSEAPGGELDENDQFPRGSLAAPQNPDTSGAGVVMNTDPAGGDTGDTDTGSTPPSTQKSSGGRRSTRGSSS